MPYAELLPSGNFRARYILPDGTVRSAGSFTFKKAAEAAAAVAEDKARSLGWRDPRAAAKTWGEWCADWWEDRPVSAGTLKREVSPRNKHLMPRWGDVALIDITRLEVKGWAAKMRRDGLAPASVQRYVHIFSASLSAAVDAEILVANPAARLKLPGGETDVHRYLTADETGALLNATTDPLIPLLLGTGLRWGEGAGLYSRRINAERQVIRVAEVWDSTMQKMLPYSKGRKIRNVGVPEWALEGMLPLMESAGKGRIFGSLDLSNWRRDVWNPALEKAGLFDVRIHDLRHTYASVLLSGGRSLAEVGAILGHESPATTQRYAHLMHTNTDAVMALLPDPRGVFVGFRGAASPHAEHHGLSGPKS